MLKCANCNFDNEDGSLFCENCKGDLSTAAPPSGGMGIPVAQLIDDMVPMAQVLDAPFAYGGSTGVPMGQAMPGHAHETPLPTSEMAPMSQDAGVANISPEDVHPAPLPGMTPPLEIRSPGEPPRVDEMAHAAASAPAAAAGAPLPAGAQPKLVVIRGMKVGAEFPIYAEDNYIGRADDKPVDVDLEDQEPPDRVWCSRQHAVIHFDATAGTITVEDLNSSNGTYVNRQRVYPGQPCPLAVNDTVQIGTVHLKLKV